MRLAGLFLLLSVGTCLAQGNDAASTASAASGGGEQRTRVEVGAGATSAAVTTGSSGPATSSPRTEPPRPLDPGFAIHPAVDPFWGPRALAIDLKPTRRCEVISDGNARRHCEGARDTASRRTMP